MALAHPLSAPVSAVPDLSLQWVPELPWCMPTFSPFSSKGCYNDTGTDSILPMRSDANQYTMTQSQCWAICKGMSGLGLGRCWQRYRSDYQGSY